MIFMDEAPLEPVAINDFSFTLLGSAAAAILIVLAALAVAGVAVFLIIKAIRNKK